MTEPLSSPNRDLVASGYPAFEPMSREDYLDSLAGA